MRTTLSIDDDIYAIIISFSQQKGLSIGKTVSNLLRQVFEKSPAASKSKNGIPLLPTSKRGVPISMQTINELRDQE